MSPHAIFTLNAGSSSIKFAAFCNDGGVLSLLAQGGVEERGEDDVHFIAHDAQQVKLAERLWQGQINFYDAAFGEIVEFWRAHFADIEVVACGHRVVHGGVLFVEPVEITAEVFAKLESLVELAPLHQPHNLEGIKAAQKYFPRATQIACFDTAFHHTNPLIQQLFALPRHFYDEGVRHYGFHGISYEFVSFELARIAPEIAQGRVVMAHLGSGASLCAMDRGKSVTTTMGFTALDGLPMGTRCGQIDAGVVLYLLQSRKMDAAGITDLLYKKSGLLGISGISADMRTLENSSDPAAHEAIDYFVAHLKRELGGLAATLGGLDAVVFCAGIGEHSPRIRKETLQALAFLGIEIDDAANEKSQTLISTPGSRVKAFVIPTNEELMIARHVQGFGLPPK